MAYVCIDSQSRDGAMHLKSPKTITDTCVILKRITETCVIDLLSTRIISTPWACATDPSSIVPLVPPERDGRAGPKSLT